MHYKIIFLIISSSNEEVYSQMKELQPKIYNLYGDQVKYFFIENRSDLSADVIEENNYLYITGSESFVPGIYQKSIKAIEYITNNYSFDYVIRTNLSTIWHMQNLFNLLDNSPKERFAGGFAFQGFISGTGIIMSRDVGILVYTNPNSSYIGDDLAISQTIQSHGVSLYDVQEYKWGFLIPRNDNLPGNCRYLDINENNFSDILNFRIKNADRVNTDIYYFKMLINKLYGGEPVINQQSVIKTPVIQQSVIETQVIETPVIQTPVIQTPIIETPIIEMQQYIYTSDYNPPEPEDILPSIKIIRLHPLLRKARRR